LGDSFQQYVWALCRNLVSFFPSQLLDPLDSRLNKHFISAPFVTTRFDGAYYIIVGSENGGPKSHHSRMFEAFINLLIKQLIPAGNNFGASRLDYVGLNIYDVQRVFRPYDPAWRNVSTAHRFDAAAILVHQRYRGKFEL